MASSFKEVLPARLQEGARQELAEVAAQRCHSACSIARKAIIPEIEKAKRKELESAA
jgi:hypothetical protein